MQRKNESAQNSETHYLFTFYRRIMNKTYLLPLSLATTLLAGCWSPSAQYTGVSFPQTNTSRLTFQEEGVPADCTAFAHLLMNSKTVSTGKDIASAMHSEAESKGANLVLVGMSREMPDKEFDETRFSYYGPEYAYSFAKTWLGWKFGFDEWNEAGVLTDMGWESWGNGNITYDNSLVIQAVFLRCEQSREYRQATLTTGVTAARPATAPAQ